MSKHATSRAHWWASIGGDLLAYLKKNMDPLFLLGFDDVTGSSTLVDSSGNGNDFTITGSPTLEAGTDTLFSGAAQSMDITGTGQRGMRESIATTNGDFSIVAIWQVDATGTVHRVFEYFGSARNILYTQGGLLTYFDGVNHPTTRSINVVGFNSMIGVSVEGAGKVAHIYENGILHETVTTTYDRAMVGGYADGASWGDYKLGAQPAYGYHRLGMLSDKTLSADDHYNIWKEATGGLTHDWLERPSLQTNCVFHAPLWEEAGSQCISVDGSDANHGTYVGGPSLGQTPLGDGAVYSVNCGIGQYAYAPNTIGDVFANDCTFSMRCSVPDLTITRGIFSVGTDGVNRFDLVVQTTGSIWFEAFDGANVNRIQSSASVIAADTPFDVCVRQSSGTVELFVNGSSIGTKSIATHTKTNTGTINYGHRATNAQACSVELPRAYNVAKLDADCLTLSGG